MEDAITKRITVVDRRRRPVTHNPRRRGRPATGQTPVRSVRIGPIWDEAKAIAKANNETISSVIERKLTEYVKNARTEENGEPT